MNGYDAQDMASQGADGFRNGYQAGYADAVKAIEAAQPAAAQEAVAWQWRSLRANTGWKDCTRAVYDVFRQNGLNYEVRKLYAAPVTAAPAVAYLIDGRTEQGLTFDKAAAETMAFANGGTVRALGFVGGTPAAPGIDMGAPGATLTIDGKTFTVDEVRAALLPGTSPKDELESWKRGTKACAEVLGQVMRQTQDSHKGGGEAVSDAMIYAALRVQYARAGSLWTGSEANPDFTDMRHILSAAMQAQAGDAEVQP